MSLPVELLSESTAQDVIGLLCDTVAAVQDRCRPIPRTGRAVRPAAADAVLALGGQAIAVTGVGVAPPLLYPPTMPYAVAAGTTAFTCLEPRQLITFSGLTLSTYLAFAA
ncbi:hypothetical protein [Streptomyces clavifer]|uniref:hypothetical protein n=1 Tax=Streptomyces clavifer TaxID=68188 RepID=UPI00369495A7